jgi:hypothetical protein
MKEEQQRFRTSARKKFAGKRGDGVGEDKSQNVLCRRQTAMLDLKSLCRLIEEGKLGIHKIGQPQ